MALKHKKITGKAAAPAHDVDGVEWDKAHLFDDAVLRGSLLVRETTDAINGYAFVASGVGVLMCSAAGNLPTFGQTPTLKTLTLNQGVITPPTPNISGTVTWNDAAEMFTGWLLNVTDTASDAASLLLDLQVGGASKFGIDKFGQLYLTAGVFVPSSSGVGWVSRGYATAVADGVWMFANTAQTGFGRLMFGGSGAGNPALKPSGSSLQVRLANDTDFAQLDALQVTLSNYAAFGAVPATTGTLRLPHAGGAFGRNNANSANHLCFDFGGYGTDILRVGSDGAGTLLYGLEIAEPAAPAANGWVIYAKDNGSGKTQLCVRFNTGAVQVLATEP